MKHSAGMALMLCFLTPALAFSDSLLSPMPAALAVPNSAFSDLAPASAAAPTSPNLAPASAPSPAFSDLTPASAAAPTSPNLAPVSAPPVSTPKPANCHSCGDLEIPYPFGIGDRCAAAWPTAGMSDFNVTCNYSFTPPKPFSGDFEILNITLETGEMHVVSPLSYICYSSNTTVEPDGTGWSIQLLSSFRISRRRNTFTAIGCSTTAFLAGREDWSYYIGCTSTCASLNHAAQDYEECAGHGCCQMPIPGNLSTIAIQWGNISGGTNPAWNYSPCSYAFVAEKDWYQFRREDLIRDGNSNFTSRVSSSIPVVFDWAIMSDGPCLITQNGKTTSACISDNSQCVKATEGNGYLCNCSTGYQGNPYVNGGCTNINECELRKSNPTKYATLYPCHSGTCEDTPGDYKCKCKLWHRGDGKSDQGCRPMVQGSTLAIVATLVTVVLLACLFIFVFFSKRKIQKQRTCISKNGSDVLKDLKDIEIFTKGDLRKITNDYKKPIGEGYFGKVYEGTINGTQVAVKCSREKKDARDRQAKLQHEAPRHEQEASWKDGFLKEISFQFRFSHKNMVRLLGCCLETDIPILVFEFVPSGSLSGMLHGVDKRTLSLSKRLDIAIGSAEALSYMHSHGEHNHVHGDLKPDNILLDGDLNPKVSDFGSSRLLSMNTYARGVATDGAYSDPAYHKTGRFTVKSDVYSFGVVLLELITRRPARYGNSSLVIDFKKSCKDKGNGHEMYDTEILSDGDAESQCNIECLDMVGALAICCLKEDAEERPTMDEVVAELMQAKSVACSTDSYNEVN